MRRIDIPAPLDVIWAVADDPDGSLVNSPTMVRLTIIHRWDERAGLVPEALGRHHDAWLLRVKAAAETLAGQG